MFKLIKLAIYGLLGYVIYEFARGIFETADKPPTARANSGAHRQRAAMGAPSGGRRVRTEEATGGSVSHVVGRGVVRR